MSIHRTTLCLGNAEDVPVIVHYTAHAACKGGTDGPGGPKLEPDEPAFIEIDSVTTRDGYLIQLAKLDERALRDQIAEELDDDNDAAYEAHCDRMREERQDDA